MKFVARISSQSHITYLYICLNKTLVITASCVQFSRLIRYTPWLIKTTLYHIQKAYMLIHTRISYSKYLTVRFMSHPTWGSKVYIYIFVVSQSHSAPCFYFNYFCMYNSITYLFTTVLYSYRSAKMTFFGYSCFL